MNPSSQYEDLINDLFYLKKDSGCTPARLKQASALLQVLGGEDEPYEVCCRRLSSAIGSLQDKENAEALLVALAFHPKYAHISLLQNRRIKYGKEIGRGPETIANRESAAISELAIQLISARYNLSPLPGGIPAMHNSAIHERIEICTLVRDQRWVETREMYKMIPLIDDLEYVTIGSDIRGIFSSTCECTLKTTVMKDGKQHRFYYPRPLRRGVPAVLSLSMIPDTSTDEPPILLEETRAFHEPTLSFGLEIVFMGDKPTRLWRYEQLSIYERPGAPKKSQLLDLNGGSVARAEFTDLYGGLFAGVAWEW